MLHRLHAKWIAKRGMTFNSETKGDLESCIDEIIQRKKSCTLIVIGSPGTGKTTASQEFIKHGFLSYDKSKIYVIDDLTGENGERYTKKSIRKVTHTHEATLLILSDFRAARYIRNADIGLFIVLHEEKRLSNLKKRSQRSLKRYKNRFYRYPPVPFTYNYEKFYVCHDTLLNTLHG
jgi:Cdc6-like AAA superfamily ATPase